MNPRRARRVTILAAVVLALQLTVFLSGCADRLLLFPTRGRIAHSEELRRHEVAVPDGTLEIWIARSRPREQAEGFVLAFDGNASRAEYAAERVAELFADRPVEVWAVNYPGYGGSSGRAELARFPATGLAAYDALARAAAGRPIAVYGNSIGGTVALHVAAERTVSLCVLQNPPPLRRLVLQRNGWWNLWLLAVPVALAIPSELDAIGNAERVSAPGVVVTAVDDTIVPASYQDRVYEAYAGPKRRVLTTGGHNDAMGSGAEEEVRGAIGELMR